MTYVQSRAQRDRRPRGDRRADPAADPRCRPRRRALGRRAGRAGRHAPARCVPSPQGAARRRAGGGPPGCPAAAVPAPPRTADGARRLARAVPRGVGRRGSTRSSGTCERTATPIPPNRRNTDDRRPHHAATTAPWSAPPTAASSASNATSPYPIRDVWDAITDPARLADWWLPFDADITVDLREGGEMVFAGRRRRADDDDVHDPARRAADAARAHPRRRPARPCGGSSSRSTTGCVLRLSHFVTDAERRDRQLLRRRTARPRWPGSCRASPAAPSPGTGTASPPPRRTTPTSASPRRSPRRERAREQLLRVQNFMLSTDGFGSGEGQSLERPFGHADPGRAGLVGRRHRELAEPHRTRRHPRARRLLHPRLRPQHRRRDHGSQQVRPAARPVGGPRLGGLVGRHAAVPHAGVRPHPPPPTELHAGRHHVPLPRCHAAGGAAARPRTAADGKDVRLGGGVATVREFLDADLVDTMHVAVAPIELGRGERLWNSPDELLDRFHLEVGAEPERRRPPPLLAPLTRPRLRCGRAGTARSAAR